MVETQQGHPDPLAGVGGVTREGSELQRGLLVPSVAVRRLGGQETSLESLPALDGGARHALGERVVAAFAGRLGPGQQEIRAPAAADEAERRQEQRVVLAAATGRLCERPGQHALGAVD